MFTLQPRHIQASLMAARVYLALHRLEPAQQACGRLWQQDLFLFSVCSYEVAGRSGDWRRLSARYQQVDGSTQSIILAYLTGLIKLDSQKNVLKSIINPLENLPINSETLVREAVNKLDYDNMSLLYLSDQQDTNLIEILNNNLTESEIQQILEFVGSRTFDNNILKLILRNLDTDVLNTFLTLADGTGLGIRQYAEFANLLSYVYPGIRHPNTAIYVLKAAMVEILTENVPVININEELNNAVQNANESLSSPEQTNEMARRNFNSIISQALNRN